MAEYSDGSQSFIRILVVSAIAVVVFALGAVVYLMYESSTQSQSVFRAPVAEPVQMVEVV